MQDGLTVRNGYKLDLDALSLGDRIGMMRCGDGTLHYFYNGIDQGVACTDLAQGRRLGFGALYTIYLILYFHCTVEPRVSGPPLSGYFHYADAIANCQITDLYCLFTWVIQIS